MGRPKIIREHLNQENPEWVAWCQPVSYLLAAGPKTAIQLSHYYDPEDLGGIAACLAWLEDNSCVVYDQVTNEWVWVQDPPYAKAFNMAVLVDLISHQFNVTIQALLDPQLRHGKVIPARVELCGILASRFTPEQVAQKTGFDLNRTRNLIALSLQNAARKHEQQNKAAG